MKTICLNSNWLLRQESLFVKASSHALVENKIQGWLKASIPCDVRVPLLENGLITEPLIGENCYKSQWIEEKSWWFKKEFCLSENDLSHTEISLVCESLDVYGEIFLNGVHIATHKSAFYPFEKYIKPYLRVGSNTLLIRLTTGLEHLSVDERASFLASASSETDANGKPRGDQGRVFLRKPQYCFGWDWSPRVASCGIMKDIYLKMSNDISIEYAKLSTISIRNITKIHATVEVINNHIYSTKEADVDITLRHKDESFTFKKHDVFLCSGVNYVEIDMEVDNPKLWWPNGMGEANLYEVSICASTKDENVQYPKFNFGIRTITVNMDKSSDINNDRRFIFVVNGREIFAKGANWIPADAVYGRITDEKYCTLVDEAKQANFNMLRIWGGGLYEKDAFYDACDKCGIMLWHDFMFACGLYPDREQDFVGLVEKEANYQTRRLSNRASMALWCGNNECHEVIAYNWFKEGSYEYLGGAYLYNRMLPNIVKSNCPDIFYWNSSPYGGDGPHDTNVGDRHHWGDCMMNDDMEKRITPEEYDKAVSKFISEYGYIGPCVKESIEEYHGDNKVVKYGKIWQFHNNTFEKHTVPAGINKHYGNPEKMDIDQYILYSSLCQSLMYEYSLSTLRAKLFCGGGLFWMYSDCWGETGWTIVDYYLRRKVAFYGVKRAFEPVKLVIRNSEKENFIDVSAFNDTIKNENLDIEYGYMSFDGKIKETNNISITLPASSRNIVCTFEKGDFDTKTGAYFAKVKNNNVLSPALLRSHDFKQLITLGENTDVAIESIEIINEKTKVTIFAKTYAHAISINMAKNYNLSDCYFDMLPNQRKEIMIDGKLNSENISLSFVENFK